MTRKKKPAWNPSEHRVPKASKLQLPEDLVPHPRYGSEPGYTRLDLGNGQVPSFEPLQRICWDEPRSAFFEFMGLSHSAHIIRGTGIQAKPVFMCDIEMYYDILRVCVDCRHHFIFYAAEQKHWREELGFSSGADCIRCVNCRKLRQSDERSHLEYQRVFAKTRKSLADYTTLVEAAVDLHRQGKLKLFDKLRALLNAAEKAHPDHKSQERIASLRQQIKDAEEADAERNQSVPNQYS